MGEEEAPRRLRPPTEAQPLELVVVDDNALFRRTLARLIERIPRLHLLGEADSGQGLESLLALQAPELLLLDLEVGTESGFELLPLCLRRRPEMAVILLTGHDPWPLQAAAVERGALGCWSKTGLRGLLAGLAEDGALPPPSRQ